MGFNGVGLVMVVDVIGMLVVPGYGGLVRGEMMCSGDDESMVLEMGMMMMMIL